VEKGHPTRYTGGGRQTKEVTRGVVYVAVDHVVPMLLDEGPKTTSKAAPSQAQKVYLATQYPDLFSQRSPTPGERAKMKLVLPTIHVSRHLDCGQLRTSPVQSGEDVEDFNRLRRWPRSI
jgi:hypothetical protein